MKPIINPLWIYFAEKCNVISVFCVTISVIFITVAIVWYFVWLSEKICNDNVIQCPKWVPTLGIICLIIGTLLPSQKTVLTMMTMNQITPNNVQIVSGTATDVVDYIVDKIDELINDKER